MLPLTALTLAAGLVSGFAQAASSCPPDKTTTVTVDVYPTKAVVHRAAATENLYKAGDNQNNADVKVKSHHPKGGKGKGEGKGHGKEDDGDDNGNGEDDDDDDGGDDGGDGVDDDENDKDDGDDDDDDSKDDGGDDGDNSKNDGGDGGDGDDGNGDDDGDDGNDNKPTTDKPTPTASGPTSGPASVPASVSVPFAPTSFSSVVVSKQTNTPNPTPVGSSPAPGQSSASSPAKPSSVSSPTPSSSSSPATPNGSLWKPRVGATWQIILRSTIDSTVDTLTPEVEVWDIDANEHPDETVKKLHASNKKVICYFSAGSWENWRADKDKFAQADLGSVLEGWPDERWLNTASSSVRAIMSQRIADAASKGCDAIDPDNVDGFANKNGIGLTKEGAVDYIKFLAKEARSHNMAIGLKNAAEIIDDVMDVVDFSVNEQCAQFGECDTFAKFIKAGKPVFQIEYPNDGSNNDNKKRRAAQIEERAALSGAATKTCKSMESGNLWGFSTVIKNMDLDGWVQYCDGNTFSTKIVGGGK